MFRHYYVSPEIKVMSPFSQAYCADEVITVFKVVEEWLVVVAGKSQLMGMARDVEALACFVFHLGYLTSINTLRCANLKALRFAKSKRATRP